MKKKNYLTAMVIALVMSLAHFGIVSISGYAEHWNVWQKITFPIMNTVLAVLPMVGALKFYQKVKS